MLQVRGDRVGAEGVLLTELIRSCSVLLTFDCDWERFRQRSSVCVIHFTTDSVMVFNNDILVHGFLEVDSDFEWRQTSSFSMVVNGDERPLVPLVEGA